MQRSELFQDRVRQLERELKDSRLENATLKAEIAVLKDTITKLEIDCIKAQASINAIYRSSLRDY